LPNREEIVASIRALIARRWPERFTVAELDDQRSLGSEGLGLDSIEIVEVITACEQLLGREADAALFASVPLTMASMADFFRC
jgi:acyl carrier protein